MPPVMELRLFHDKMAFKRAHKLKEDIGLTSTRPLVLSQLEDTAKTGFRRQECVLGRA